jgi:DNA-binding helix-hairpin-helix protein with protein kinase domain
MRYHLEDTARPVLLESAALARGGEAAIYRVQDQPELVAKVFHRPTAEHAAKLAAMLAAPLSAPRGVDGHIAVAWPMARLLDSADRVAGYVMPHVPRALPICEFYNPSARWRHSPLFHHGYLLRTARNLAVCVRTVHDAGCVIGDLNESNVLVTNRALVTLVDTDSFQVRGPDRLFRCRVGKPEFTPPELQGVFFADQDRDALHDHFALAVLIFQLLMQGIHPYAGCDLAGDEPSTLAARIVAGHWPYGWQRRAAIAPLPTAPPWSILPAAVQDLLWRCFDAGHCQPAARPSARDWQLALEEAEERLTVCAINEQHVFGRGLDVCPWCVLDQQQGRDPFPSRDEFTKRQARARALQIAMRSAPRQEPAALIGAVREDPDPLPAVIDPAVARSWMERILAKVGAALEGPSWTTWVTVAVLAALVGIVSTLHFHR